MPGAMPVYILEEVSEKKGIVKTVETKKPKSTMTIIINHSKSNGYADLATCYFTKKLDFFKPFEVDYQYLKSGGNIMSIEKRFLKLLYSNKKCLEYAKKCKFKKTMVFQGGMPAAIYKVPIMFCSN